MSTSSVNCWRGIRYAWTAHRFSSPTLLPLSRLPEPGGEFGPAPWQAETVDIPLGAPQGDECLSLNIWAPTDAHDLPVVFWLYGGGFEQGAASIPIFDGKSLAARASTIVVTLNYRVGAYGFAALSSYGGRLAEASNLGLRDALCAYQWVRATIRCFGGDPNRITVAGQSAGGFIGCALAVAPTTPAPAALACFSGGASRIVPQDTSAEIARGLLRELGIERNPERIIDLDPASVVKAQEAVIPQDLGERNGPTPRAFGVTQEAPGASSVVPRHPMDAIADGALRSTAILSSATSWELMGFSNEKLAIDTASAEDDITTFAGVSAQRIRAEYGKIHEDATRSRARVLTDFIYRLPAARLVDAQRAAGGAATLLEISVENGSDAGHGCELEAIFAADESAESERNSKISMILAELIRDPAVRGEEEVGPHVAGHDDLGGAFPMRRLTEIWEGIERP